jgi:CheY-like chemotaxis protein
MAAPGMHRVLVVDDDDDIREAFATYLAAVGFDVVTACDGADALRVLRAARDFCLVVLDLFMPGMNGWEFREQQLRDPDLAGIPVVVVSAAGRDSGMAALHAVAQLPKPVDFARLAAVCGEHC